MALSDKSKQKVVGYVGLSSDWRVVGMTDATVDWLKISCDIR